MSQVIYYAHGSPGRESGVVSNCDTMAELSTLLHSEIPEGRSNLTDNHTNLERVAEYCEANYFQSDSKRGALEETKNYTTQSLASVAYQINTLAYNFLQLLELQTSQLAEMESQMNHISQTVMIHKEKVARREIGVLTANKSTTRHYKIIAPAVPEKPIKYIRRAIDYNVLDDIGHGVRSGTPRGPNKGGLQRGNSQSGSMQALVGNNGVMLGQAGGGGSVGQVGQPGVGPAPTTKPPTPPSVTRTGSKVSVSGGTLSKGSNREYRTPPAVAPPQVPSHYAPNYPIGHPRRAGSDSNSSSSGGTTVAPLPNNVPRGPAGYSALPLGPQGQVMSPPGGGTMQQIGMVHPMSVHPSQQQMVQQHPQTPPPPPPPTATGSNGAASMYTDHHNSMPPPPSPLTIPITTNQQSLSSHHHQQTPPSLLTATSHFGGHSLHLPQHGPVPAGSLGMHTLSHHHQAQYLQSIQRSLGGMNRQSSLSSNVTVTGGDASVGGNNRGGQNSPPLPPPPPMMSDANSDMADDIASVHAAFGRPQGAVGGLLGRGISRGGGGDELGGGVRPIVPDEEDLPGWVPKNYIEKVVAIYDYYADKDDELSFQESSVIYVLKKNDDGWWEGVMDGITGLFPGNYVEPCV